RENGVKRKICGLLVFSLASILGYVIFDLKALSGSEAMFPLFSGLFGISAIVYSLNQAEIKIPQRPYSRYEVGSQGLFAGFVGTLGGLTVGFLPAMSPSQIGIIFSGLYGSTTVGFLTAVSATNTADAIYSLVSLTAIGKGRSGVSEMLASIMELNTESLGLLTSGICSTTMFIYVLHIYCGKKLIKHYNKIGYKKLSTIVLFIIVTLVYLLTGFLGLYILFVSSMTGLTAVYSGVSRTHLMGVIIFPTLTYII
ncbi:MAG: tripartite tricarboxylate transporter permease, partial [Candidatus Altiarchaeota archaeon]|nr:tripartite tricarboxylate transporter permease [Candidatus Altiarchaeota archaeon]